METFLPIVIIIGFVLSLLIVKRNKSDDNSITKVGYVKLSILFISLFVVSVLFVAVSN
ncbi:hypothetical protein [Bacillus sp. JCM 19034]|uniref:hypothetical protein n=1 Tax=Bacillus sp. JCM 19034 TaxID=1481928 RepID=UPI000A67BF55|nr:hypothetical protein [Bacillus sp. JCM 19034]